MKTSIALVGFMGTGKTAVGRVLAAWLDKDFVETDALIEQKAGKSIPEIFRDDGEIAFREVEMAVIREVAARDNAVIACGGGAVLNKINIDRLRERCTIINLKASPRTIARRTADDGGNRPLLAVADRARQIKELLDYRRPFYRRAADIEVNTSRLSVDRVVATIIQKLKEHESDDS